MNYLKLLDVLETSLRTPEELEILEMCRERAILEKKESIRKNEIRMNKLYNGLDYELNLYYNDSKKPFEEIFMEGYTNTISLYDTYRKIGHSIGLRKVTIMLDGKKVKSVNFKY